MSIWTTEPTSATQRAVWTSHDKRFQAAVNRQSTTDERGARGWAYELEFPVSENEHGDTVAVRHTFADPKTLIYAPMDPTPIEVLATLASFLSAWEEAIQYNTRMNRQASENTDLFPMSCENFMEAICDFELECMDVTEEETQQFG